MGLFRTAGRVVKPLVNVPRWLGLKELITWPKNIIAAIVRVMFVDPASIRRETFAEAVARQKLTEQQLRIRSRQLIFYTVIYGLIGLALLTYGIFLLTWGDYKAAVVAFILVIAAFLLAYREHFRHFQIEQRRLGCTFKDWMMFYMYGGKKPSETSTRRDR